MATPNVGDVRKPRSCFETFCGAPGYVSKYYCRILPDNRCVHTDSDVAGCIKSRMSTSGGAMLFGPHSIKSWSTNQAAVALSLSEAEYYRIVTEASNIIRLENLVKDLGYVATGKLMLY